jgi:monoamine oxidase
MIYDIIIIGCGISGLNTAYQLLSKKPYLKILLLEKNNYLGGRIKTFTKKINNHNYIWEEGAGRLNDNHKLFLKLIDDFGLTNNLSKINSNITFYPSKGTVYTKFDNDKYSEYSEYNEYKEFINKSPFYYINKVTKYSKKDKKENIQKYTFKEYCRFILNEKEIQFILDSFGYYAQLVKMNAYNAIKLFNDGMNPKLQFYHLNPGLNIIIKKLEKKIIENNGKILLNTNVSNINYDNLTKIFQVYLENENIIYKSKICILAIPKPELLRFNILNKIHNELNSINYKSLCRIYSVFKKEDIWFKDIPKCTTNNNLRYIIPIDKENGLIMISYSDSKFANYWNKLYLYNEKLFIDNLKKYIYKTYNKKIENPIYTKISYWDCAVGFWKKNKDSNIISNKIIHPYDNINLFICGENYSETQGWIEGALETSFIVINKINKII